jgi:pimeloyl-ACP methyl ester carboxylesterase
MPSLRSALASVDLPVRLVAGDRDPKFVALARAIAGALPRAEVRLVRGCGHDPLVEDPEAAAAAIIEPLPEGTEP